MRISLNWLRELVDINLSPEDLAHTLTMAGFEVEDIEDRRSWADGVVLGKILKCEQHPNADKLRVCQVDIGTGEDPLNIVCGAPNARADIFVAIAVVGTFLPHVNLKIKPAKLRGVPSEGMICSLAELGLMKESAGIHIFDGELPSLGSDVRPLLGLDDIILDLTATANRADALSMVGVAREVAALTGATLKLPQVPDISLPDTDAGLRVSISASQGCPVYIGTAIRDVKIAPSPQWLQQRLQAGGVRPINNVVDVTNYILLEWGQPLHAFDADRLHSLTGSDDISLGVRFATEGETIKTLDGQTRNLQSQNLLIVANDKPVAIAGVMGGEDTEVHEGTTNLVLEAAIFDSPTIRRSARAQGLRSESSIRYERGVNQAALMTACNRAIHLLREIAGGTPTVQKIAGVVGTAESFTRSVELRLDRVNQVLGTLKRADDGGEPYLQSEEIKGILSALGCEINATDKPGILTVIVPSYRYRDLEREIDLIEEIARLHGYDNFAETLPGKTSAGYLPLEEHALRQIRAAFRASGLTELMHYSLVKTEGDNQVVIANPLFVEYSALRTEMLTGLIDAFQYNLEQGNQPLNGFEVGRIFWKEGDSLREKDMLAGVIGGDPTQGKWQQGGRDRALTWFEAKGILESVFQRLGIGVEYQRDSSNSHLHPGRTAGLFLNGKPLGIFGQLHPQLQQEKGLPEAVYVFQFDLGILVETLNQPENLVHKFSVYSSFPAADRDIAFFAPVDVAVIELSGVMQKAAGNLLESVELFDEYRGQNVPEGQRSLAFRLVYRVRDRTLSDTDIDPVQQKVRDALVKQFNVTLRS